MSTHARVDDQRLRVLLHELIGRVRSGQPIANLLVSGVDAYGIAQQLRPLAVSAALIEAIAGSDERVDASVSVHDGWTYDLQFDTTESPEMRELADLVLTRTDR